MLSEVKKSFLIPTPLLTGYVHQSSSSSRKRKTKAITSLQSVKKPRSDWLVVLKKVTYSLPSRFFILAQFYLIKTLCFIRFEFNELNNFSNKNLKEAFLIKVLVGLSDIKDWNSSKICSFRTNWVLYFLGFEFQVLSCEQQNECVKKRLDSHLTIKKRF